MFFSILEDDDSDDYSSAGGSPRSKSPTSPEHESNELPSLNNTAGSGRWWRFGGSNTVSDVKKEEKDKEEEKKVQPEEKKTPLQKILDEIPGLVFGTRH